LPALTYTDSIAAGVASFLRGAVPHILIDD
jgi:hypothetical protein